MSCPNVHYIKKGNIKTGTIMRKLKTSPLFLKLTSYSLGLTFVRNHVTNVFVLQIAQTFGLNTVELGGMLSARFVAQIFVPLVMGRVADLIGKKKVLALAFILEILGTLMMAVSPTIGWYIAGVLVQGSGNGCVSVSLTENSCAAGLASTASTPPISCFPCSRHSAARSASSLRLSSTPLPRQQAAHGEKHSSSQMF